MRLPKNLLSDSYRAPSIYLCQTNKDRIGELTAYNRKGTFKWNAYSEISFDIDRDYCDINTGEIIVNPYYDRVEALRLVEVEGFGFFQLQDPEIDSDGIKEIKSINANSLEYDLSQRYLENFIINKGMAGSIDEVQLYNQNDPEHSLLNLVIAEKAPDWKIGHVDASLATQRRFFEIDRESVYDFLMNEMCETFKCVIEFDTYENSINVYEEETAGIDTDVVISFDNLSNKINVKYSADDIKTVLTVEGADDLNIREVNYGLPYITDLSYYHTVDWMGQELYDAYAEYLKIVAENKEEYLKLKEEARKYTVAISDYKNRVDENLTDKKIEDFHNFVLELYKTYDFTELKDESINESYKQITAFDVKNMEDIKKDFEYIDKTLWSEFESSIMSENQFFDKEAAILKILSVIWDAYGLNTLKIYEAGYKERQTAEVDGELSNTNNDFYYKYRTTFIMLTSVKNDISERNTSISIAQTNLDDVNTRISNIVAITSLQNNLTQEQIIRLAPFLREDEYTDDNFVITDVDTDEDKLKTQEELLDAGYTELRKMSEPKLSFTTDIANVFALDEFAPIINQFQLGNMIKIELRPDYLKKSRLMEAEISFDDLSDFGVTFGDLLSIRDEADIHADLLSQAINAGKSVANNSSNWQKGSDKVNSIEQAINQGLLDAATEIKSIDGTQQVSVDKYGIHLRKLKDGSETEYDDEQGWIVSNKFLYTDDAWKTTKSVFGKYNYKGEDRWGILADALIGKYLEGMEIEGGSIKIGYIGTNEEGEPQYTFEVTEDGTVKINSLGEGSELESTITTLSEKPYEVIVESSNVPVFDDTIQSTVLTCYIYKDYIKVDPKEVDAKFTWTRYSSNTSDDTVWNNNHKDLTDNYITVNAEDVENSAQFSCEVFIP